LSELRGVLRLAGLVGLLLSALPALAQDDDASAGSEPRFVFAIEGKAHFRNSEEVRFPIKLEFPPIALPVGQNKAFLETVNAGSHLEVSDVTLRLDLRLTDNLHGRIKIDLIDRYHRNPTSEDRQVDFDEVWLTWGRETEPARVPERRGQYLKIGKFPKFERQDDRHLESYGLMATAFNFLEDIGVELGADLGRHAYAKVQYTAGNPLFFRDPNALAGDNGISIFDGSVAHPDPYYKSGLPIFYDADVDTLDFSHAELGAGLGLRFGNPSGSFGVDVLLWSYQRKLAEEAQLTNTFYGGDLDLLDGPGGLTPLPVTSNDKSENGANLWLYAGGFSFFGQLVKQDLAGLERNGYEAEVAWSFDLPLFASIGGRQVLPWIAPAIRYSELEPEFGLDPAGLYPAPSVVWYWEKLDVGLRIGLVEGSDLTIEWSHNEFIRAGKTERQDELLVTLHIGIERGFGH